MKPEQIREEADKLRYRAMREAVGEKIGKDELPLEQAIALAQARFLAELAAQVAEVKEEMRRQTNARQLDHRVDCQPPLLRQRAVGSGDDGRANR